MATTWKQMEQKIIGLEWQYHKAQLNSGVTAPFDTDDGQWTSADDTIIFSFTSARAAAVQSPDRRRWHCGFLHTDDLGRL